MPTPKTKTPQRVSPYRQMVRWLAQRYNEIAPAAAMKTDVGVQLVADFYDMAPGTVAAAVVEEQRKMGKRDAAH